MFIYKYVLCFCSSNVKLYQNICLIMFIYTGFYFESHRIIQNIKFITQNILKTPSYMSIVLFLSKKQPSPKIRHSHNRNFMIICGINNLLFIFATDFLWRPTVDPEKEVRSEPL